MNWKTKIFKTALLFKSKADYEIGSDERYAMIIVKKLLNDKDSELLMHPTQPKKYIKSKDGSKFVVISSDPDDITIINHKYCYNVKLKHRAAHDIEMWYIDELERRRQAMETEFMKNIEHSLKTIAMGFNEELPFID